MALVDAVRRRARLDEAELAALVLLQTRSDDPALKGEDAVEAIGRLVRAGAVRGREVAGWLADLLAPVIAPTRRALAEVHAGGRLSIVASAWESDGRAVLGTLAVEGDTNFAPIDPALLPTAFAREVDLGARQAPEGREALAVTVGEVERAERERGDDPLGRLMDARVSSWRITVADSAGTRSIAVVDGGVAGLWLSVAEDEDAERVSLVPTTSPEVTDRVIGLFSP